MPVVDTPTVAVAVIGAGVAGLAAARELGRVFPDVVLLEASDRLGGRVKQVRETEGEKRRRRRESAVEIKTNDGVFDPSPPPHPPLLLSRSKASPPGPWSWAPSLCTAVNRRWW